MSREKENRKRKTKQSRQGVGGQIERNDKEKKKDEIDREECRKRNRYRDLNRIKKWYEEVVAGEILKERKKRMRLM